MKYDPHLKTFLACRWKRITQSFLQTYSELHDNCVDSSHVFKIFLTPLSYNQFWKLKSHSTNFVSITANTPQIFQAVESNEIFNSTHFTRLLKCIFHVRLRENVKVIKLKNVFIRMMGFEAKKRVWVKRSNQHDSFLLGQSHYSGFREHWYSTSKENFCLPNGKFLFSMLSRAWPLSKFCLRTLFKLASPTHFLLCWCFWLYHEMYFEHERWM